MAYKNKPKQEPNDPNLEEPKWWEYLILVLILATILVGTWAFWRAMGPSSHLKRNFPNGQEITITP